MTKAPEIGPPDPEIGQFMLHIPNGLVQLGEVFADLAQARAAAKAEKRGAPQLAVYILQVVDVA